METAQLRPPPEPPPGRAGQSPGQRAPPPRGPGAGSVGGGASGRRALPVPLRQREARLWFVRRRREGRKAEGKPRGREDRRHRHHDGGQEQQDAPAHRLPHALHPAGRPRLHRHLQGLRQAHEPHPLRLRRVQEDQAQELQAARAGREASAGPGFAARRESGFHDSRGATPKRYWHCSRAPGWSCWRTWCWQSSWKGRPRRSSHAPGTRRLGWPRAWCWWPIPAGDDSSEPRDSCCGGGCRNGQYCRSPHSVCARPRRPPSTYGQRDPTSRDDGASPWHEAPHGPPDGHATWPRLPDGHATSWNEASSPWHERSPSSWHAPTQALRGDAVKGAELGPLDLCLVHLEGMVGWGDCVYVLYLGDCHVALSNKHWEVSCCGGTNSF